MSKRKDIIRVGDRVKIVTPKVVVRVGYPLTKAEMMERQTPEQLQAIRDMMRAFKTVVYPENHSDLLGAITENSANIDRLYEKVRYLMAGRMLEQEGFGGKQRRIHTYTLTGIKSRLATVTSKRVVKTGDYYHSSGGYDSYTGEYDYEPGGLSNEKTHVLYTLSVDGYGTWWSKMRNEDAFSATRRDDYKDIEIEGCNLVKIDPKNPPAVEQDFFEDEHPSGLSGEHSCVLDAIHSECLHNR
jgi:hypothetical protein